MSKWKKCKSKRYGGHEDNRKMAEMYQQSSKKGFNMKKLINIIGTIIVFLGMLSIGISIFTGISCLGTAILVLFIGLFMLWSTEQIY